MAPRATTTRNKLTVVSASVRTRVRVDFRVANHRSVCLLEPLTPAGVAWVDAYMPSNRLLLGTSILIKPRFIAAVVKVIEADGLVVARR